MKRAMLFFGLIACGPQSQLARNDDGLSDAAALANDGCAILQELQLTAGAVTDSSGDGLLSPGERIHVAVTMKHVGTTRFIDAPSLVGRVDADAKVDDSKWYYGILRGQSLAFSVVVDLSHDVQPGSTVTLSVVPSASGASCDTLTPIRVQLPIAASCHRQDNGVLGATCGDLAHLSVSDFRIEGTPGPGRTVTLKARMNELNGLDFMSYPGLNFGATETADQEPQIRYGIFGCDSVELSTLVTFARDWQPQHTVFWARLGIGTAQCSDGPGQETQWDPQP